MDIVFFCASEYGFECLENARQLKDIVICGLITTPPKYILKYNGGKSFTNMENHVFDKMNSFSAKEGIPLFVINKMNEEITIQTIKKWKPDLIVVSGWYHMIGEKILSIPPKGVVGLHASLLPQYRGGAPLVWQMINGEEKAGISLFYFEKGVDSGDIIAQSEVEITFCDSIGTLYEKVGNAGIELLKKYLPLLANGSAPRIKQRFDDGKVFPQRTPADGFVDWNQDSLKVYNFVRAQTHPYPGAFFFYRKKKVKAWKCEIIRKKRQRDKIGEIIEVCEEIYPVIATQDEDTAIKLIEYDMEDMEFNEEWKVGELVEGKSVL